MDIIEAFEKLDTLEEDYLLEMAYKRADAIDRCFNLGKNSHNILTRLQNWAKMTLISNIIVKSYSLGMMP